MTTQHKINSKKSDAKKIIQKVLSYEKKNPKQITQKIHYLSLFISLLNGNYFNDYC